MYLLEPKQSAEKSGFRWFPISKIRTNPLTIFEKFNTSLPIVIVYCIAHSHWSNISVCKKVYWMLSKNPETKYKKTLEINICIPTTMRSANHFLKYNNGYWYRYVCISLNIIILFYFNFSYMGSAVSFNNIICALALHYTTHSIWRSKMAGISCQHI